MSKLPEVLRQNSCYNCEHAFAITTNYVLCNLDDKMPDSVYNALCDLENDGTYDQPLKDDTQEKRDLLDWLGLDYPTEDNFFECVRLEDSFKARNFYSINICEKFDEEK